MWWWRFDALALVARLVSQLLDIAVHQLHGLMGYQKVLCQTGDFAVQSVNSVFQIGDTGLQLVNTALCSFKFWRPDVIVHGQCLVVAARGLVIMLIFLSI
jgi:hypothetical protein